METAIKKAIEGGYRGDSIYYDGVESRSVLGDGWRFNEEFSKKELLLDPEFWKCLGKAEWNDENDWTIIDGIGHQVDMETGGYVPVWKEKMINFMKWIAEEKSIDEFFDTLLTKETKNG